MCIEVDTHALQINLVFFKAVALFVYIYIVTLKSEKMPFKCMKLTPCGQWV